VANHHNHTPSHHNHKARSHHDRCCKARAHDDDHNCPQTHLTALSSFVSRGAPCGLYGVKGVWSSIHC
jgi:hypothetical protein